MLPRRVRDVGRIAPARAAVVEDEDAVARGERRELERPGGAVAPEPHDQDDGRPALFAVPLVVEADPVGRGERHRRLARPPGPPSLMRGQRLGERLPLVEQPGDLLLRLPSARA